MKKLHLAALAAALLAGNLYAQAPVTGTPDESMFTDSDPVKHRNKQTSLYIMRELLQCGQWDRSAEWLTDQYIQHNPNAASGRQGAVDFFTKELGVKANMDCPKLTTPITAVTAEDDLVTVMYPREYTNPNTGEKYTSTWFDTWRFVDGKADEHWDPATIAPTAAR